MITREEIENAAYEYSGKMSHPMNSAFRDGAKWYEEQILKRSVEAEVTVPASSAFKQIRYKLPKGTEYKVGDKVKILIV